MIPELLTSQFLSKFEWKSQIVDIAMIDKNLILPRYLVRRLKIYAVYSFEEFYEFSISNE